jgi:trigger factor
MIKIKENLEAYYKNESEQQVEHMISHLLEEKHEVPLPNEFLKRWLIATKENDYNFENIEEKYAQEKSALQRRLVIDKIASENNLEATEEDVKMEARVYFVGM